jgi:hypothetical protein
MPKPLSVDWPAVRVLAVAVGVREAARQMGISQDAVRQRSKREGWIISAKSAQQLALTNSVTSVGLHRDGQRDVAFDGQRVLIGRTTPRSSRNGGAAIDLALFFLFQTVAPLTPGRLFCAVFANPVCHARDRCQTPTAARVRTLLPIASSGAVCEPTSSSSPFLRFDHSPHRATTITTWSANCARSCRALQALQALIESCARKNPGNLGTKGAAMALFCCGSKICLNKHKERLALR